MGLTGGVGSGKSAVARILARRGARVVDCDRIVAGILRRPRVVAAVRRTWGADVTPGGRVDKARLARAVFGNAGALRRLERIVHPPTLREIARRLRRARRAGARAAVLDAPLLLETGLDARCDRVLFVAAPAAVRERRVRARRGWAPGERAARERRQWPLAEKRRRADAIIDNAGNLAATRRQVDRFWNRFIAPRPTRGGTPERPRHP